MFNFHLKYFNLFLESSIHVCDVFWSSPPSSAFLQFPQHPPTYLPPDFMFLIFTIVIIIIGTQSLSSADHIQMCGGCHLGTGNLPMATSPEKSESASSSSNQLPITPQLGVGSWQAFPIACENLTGLTLCGSWVESMRASALSWKAAFNKCFMCMNVLHACMYMPGALGG